MDARPGKSLVQSWTKQRDLAPLTITRADGIYLWDHENRRYADFCSGQISVNVGYNHPRVIEAIEAQLRQAAFVAPMYETEVERELAERIVARTPPGLNHVFFTNSGTEAVETAIKIARAVTGRLKIYSAWQSYHGGTTGAGSVSGDPRRLYVEPGMVGHGKFMFPNLYRGCFGESPDDGSAEIYLKTLQNQVEFEGPETIAAILVEPIVGTSGLYVPPADFMVGLRRLCDSCGILLIFDEVMSGWGRTGRWFACEHFGVAPDILVTAKGITSGYVPLGVVTMTSSIYEHFLDRPFVAGSTTEGHPLACAAGLANISIYEEEDLVSRSEVVGEHLLRGLWTLRDRHPSVGDVRGRGLFTCIELTSDRDSRAPLAGYRNARLDVAGRVSDCLLSLGLSVICKWDFIFVAPPLIVEEQEVDEALDRFDEALKLTDALL